MAFLAALARPALPRSACRASHVPDRVEMSGHSFSYKGRVTRSQDDGSSYHRVVDDAISVTTVSQRVRASADSELRSIRSRNRTFSLISAGGIGAGAVLSQTYPDFVVPATALACLSGPLAVLFGVRASSVTAELDKWNDPIERVLKLRQGHGTDVRGIEEHGLKGTIFSKEEVAHIWHHTLKKLEEDFQNACLAKDPRKLEHYLRRFIEHKSPLVPRSIAYAFHNSQEIVNPKRPEKGFWTRADINGISEAFMKIHKGLVQFDEDVAREMRKVQNQNYVNQNMANIAIAAGRDALRHRQSTVKTVDKSELDRWKNAALAPYQRERDQKLAELEQAFKGGHLLRADYEHHKAKIHQKFEKHPEVVRILTEYKMRAERGEPRQEDPVVRTAETAAQMIQVAVAANAANREQEIRDMALNGVIKRFQEPVAGLFARYHETRKKA